MKKLFLSLFIATGISSQAQVVELLNENFDNGFPAGWQSLDDDALVPYATVSYLGNSFGITEDFDSTNVGDSIAAATSWFDPVGQASNYLITPQVLLKSNGNQLYYEVKSQDPSYPDGYEVLISTTVPVIDSFFVYDSLFYTNAELPYWTERMIDLDNFVNQNIYIAFHHFSNDKFILCLDNIRIIADTTLSVSEMNKQIPVNVYPNPVSDMLYFETAMEMKNVKIELVDVSGRVCMIRNENGFRATFPVNELEKGIYFIRAYFPGYPPVNRTFIKQ